MMRGMLRILGSLSLALLLLCAPVHAEDPPPPTVTLDGRARGPADLRRMESEVRAEVERLRSSSAPAKDVIAALEAEADALGRAAALIDTVVQAPRTTLELREQIQAAKERLAEVQAAAAKEVVLEGVDEARVGALEAEARQGALQAKAAEEAVERTTAAVERRKKEFDESAVRLATLAKRGTELRAELARTPEDSVQERDLLEGQVRRNEIRRGIVLLEQAHHDALLALDLQRRDLARIQADVASTEQRRAETVLTHARSRYREQLEREAAQKEAETRRKLREAELAASPAVKAIKRMEALVGRMETERNNDLLELSALKSLRDSIVVLARVSTARAEALRVLFPPGDPLESWQREALGEQVRQLSQDEETYSEFRGSRLPKLLSTRARIVTERGRVDVFQQRIETAQDRTDIEDLERSVQRIQQELALSQSEDVRLWLQARLDFIQGQQELRPDEVERLRVTWQETATRLKAVVQARAEDLRQTETIVGEVLESAASTEQGLASRRRYLDRITFWLRGAPMTSGAFLADLGADLSRLGGAAVALPGGFAALVDDAETPAAEHIRILLLSLLGALLAGLWLRRRSGRLALVNDPLAGLDPLQRMLRSAVLLLRALLLPLLALTVALLVRREAPSSFAAAVFLALAIFWCGVGLARGLVQALFLPDADGTNLTRTPAETAAGAERVLRLGFGGFGLLVGLAVLGRSLDLGSLAHAVRVAWILLALGAGLWLLFRRDVLLAFFPADSDSLFVRTARSIIPVAWPFLLLFGLSILILDVLGYHTASSFFASRATWFSLTLLGIGIGYALGLAWLARKEGAQTDDAFVEAYDPATARRRLGIRAARQVLLLAAIAAVVVAVSTVFEVSATDWQALGAVSLAGGEAGTGITLAKLSKAIVIFVVTIILAGHARDITRVVLRTRGRLEQGSRYAIRTLLFYVLIVIGALISLAALGLDMTQFGWFLTAAGLGIGFGLQEILSNLISGLILFFERPVQVGDVVTVGEVQGDVQQISIRSTVVRTRDGVSIILPNKRLITDDVINWSHGQKRTRIQVETSVAYGSDVELVRSILMDVAAEDARVLRRPVPEVEFRAFGESELQFVLYIWLASPDIGLRRRVRSDANIAIERRFRENGITIPFPQRDIHIRSGTWERAEDPNEDAPQG